MDMEDIINYGAKHKVQHSDILSQMCEQEC